MKRWRNPRLRVGLVWIFAVAVLQCAGCYKPNESRREARAEKVDEFPTLFANNCSGCHGANGQQGPAPPIGNTLFLAMISQPQLQEIIARGRPGTLMPAFVTSSGLGLTSEQAETIAKGLKEGKLNSSPSQEVPTLVPPYRADPEASKPADISAGALLFANHCAMCHGDEGRGSESAGALNDPALLALLSNQAIRTVVITGRGDLGHSGAESMPSYLALSKVTRENAAAKWREIDQIVAYIASWRKALPPQLTVTPHNESEELTKAKN